MKKIVFIINNVDFLISHRLPILLEAQKNGFQVHVIAPNSRNNELLKKHKIMGHDLFLSRG
ncbi:glycosyltransferase family 1 protein, partial [Escherichia coli]|nr:glycosyltransferase family 1 protein [Escherichia coli]